MAVAHCDVKARGVNLEGQRLLDRYEVKEQIARGGMGVVFRGDDERLHRPVCVKVFATLDPSRPEYATILEHFVQEAFTLSRLQHPNTLRIYDFGYIDEGLKDKPFFVTEYADAGNLSELVGETGPLAATEVLRILEPMVGALREAHDAGVIHRDIKPSNILFTYAGGGLMPKLADFSIAKAFEDLPHRAQDTNVRVPLYSLSWAAPEQLTDGEIGVTADVFALGLTTAFMFTGQLVFPGSDIMQLYGLRSKGADYRSEVIEGLPLPRSVARVVFKACSEDPQRRHPSVEAFYDALSDAVDLLDRPSTSARPEISIVSHSKEVHESRATHQDVGSPGAGFDDATGASGHWDEGLEFDSSVPTGAQADMTGPAGRDLDSVPRSPSRPPVAKSAATGLPPRRVVTPASPTIAPADSSVAPPSAIDQSIVASKPQLRIDDLRSREAVIGPRRIRLHRVDDGPLEIPGIDPKDPPRLRITPVDVGGAHVHIKGLNYFVGVDGRRPSSGVSVSKTSDLDLVDASMKQRARLRVIISVPSDGLHHFALGEATLVVPVELTPWATLIELANGRDGLLLHG